MFLTILHNIEELKFVLLFGIIFTDIYNEAHMLEKICQKCELNMRHYEVSGFKNSLQAVERSLFTWFQISSINHAQCPFSIYGYI